jgi:hypothetical protein
MRHTPSRLGSPEVIRYSPKPLASYLQTHHGHTYGPATSVLLDTTEIWNLAYLSHDFETRLDHPDPQFTTNVRRSCQTLLDGTGLDLTGLRKANQLVGSWLRLPAPRFVYLILRHPILQMLPLYTAYGPSWLHLIEERSRLCDFEPSADGMLVAGEIVDLTLARAVLDQVRQGS